MRGAYHRPATGLMVSPGRETRPVVLDKCQLCPSVAVTNTARHGPVKVLLTLGEGPASLLATVFSSAYLYLLIVQLELCSGALITAPPCCGCGTNFWLAFLRTSPLGTTG
ncbi:hypothetical protein E2C01_001645 [Portunus trituberculatus]|uniref:Uncharacterized protein n=1 Tax=Portunus trituberculatus TaxID=210409 RepID=A0A5B7CN08_PORTR|nr:hypothetical protein [Portunus trituberculatus]